MIEHISKKTFVFVFRIGTSAFATARILMLFLERNIEVDEFHFHSLDSNNGRLMIHCQMERDRIGRTASLLEKLPGVIELDWMEGKRHGLRG
ncbi:MAG TPA: hypothetical protein VGZ90_00740 [Puia sp.]|jgi:hypothetical protein|nr:hypothetical protein [Puia sp.]